MDANKLKVLRELPYSIHKVCGLCIHGDFKLSDWGVCHKAEYVHEKHTGEPRFLSINQFGVCSSFEPDKTRVERLGAFKEFLEQ